jgi:hypothetical protein
MLRSVHASRFSTRIGLEPLSKIDCGHVYGAEKAGGSIPKLRTNRLARCPRNGYGKRTLDTYKTWCGALARIPRAGSSD